MKSLIAIEETFVESAESSMVLPTSDTRDCEIIGDLDADSTQEAIVTKPHVENVLEAHDHNPGVAGFADGALVDSDTDCGVRSRLPSETGGADSAGLVSEAAIASGVQARVPDSHLKEAALEHASHVLPEAAHPLEIARTLSRQTLGDEAQAEAACPPELRPLGAVGLPLAPDTEFAPQEVVASSDLQSAPSSAGLVSDLSRNVSAMSGTDLENELLGG